jgi:hypothetical protein
MVTASVTSSGGGPDVAGGVCNVRIYPKQVIKSVREQMKSLTLDPNVPIEVPPRMHLDERMKAANWKDAAVRRVI